MAPRQTSNICRVQEKGTQIGMSDCCQDLTVTGVT